MNLDFTRKDRILRFVNWSYSKLPKQYILKTIISPRIDFVIWESPEVILRSNLRSNTKEWGQFNSSRSKTTESSRFISALFSSSLKAHRFLFFFKIGESESFEKRDLLEDNREIITDIHLKTWRQSEDQLKPEDSAWSLKTQPKVELKINEIMRDKI